MKHIDRILNYDFGPEMGGCPDDCDGCSTRTWLTDKWDDKKRRAGKVLRSGAMLLKWWRSSVTPMGAGLLSLRSYTDAARLLDGPERPRVGRPRHTAEACFLAFLMQKARNIRSENELVNTLSSSRAAASFLTFLDHGREHDKSPHNRVFTRARRELAPLLEDMHADLVREAISKGLVKAEVVMLDTKPINLCGSCKRISRCGWVLRGEPVPRYCPGLGYEGARPFHKTKDERMMGWKVGTATDIESGLAVASLTSAGDTSDGRMGLELLRMVKGCGVRPRFVLMDSAFDLYTTYKFCHEELGAIAVTPLRHDWKARRFRVELDNGLRVYITPCGTPLCAAGRMMGYLGLAWKDGAPHGTVWGCPLDPDVAIACSGHGGELCEVVLRPGMHWRRICLLPRVLSDWEALYRRRKVGEQAYSHWEQNLGLCRVTHRTFAGVSFHAKLVVLTALVAALLAHDTGLGSRVRTLKEARRRLEDELLASG